MYLFLGNVEDIFQQDSHLNMASSGLYSKTNHSCAGANPLIIQIAARMVHLFHARNGELCVMTKSLVLIK